MRFVSPRQDRFHSEIKIIVLALASLARTRLNIKMWFTKTKCKLLKFRKCFNLPSSRLVSFSALYLVDDAPPCKREILVLENFKMLLSKCSYLL